MAHDGTLMNPEYSPHGPLMATHGPLMNPDEP